MARLSGQKFDIKKRKTGFNHPSRGECNPQVRPCASGLSDTGEAPNIGEDGPRILAVIESLLPAHLAGVTRENPLRHGVSVQRIPEKGHVGNVGGENLRVIKPHDTPYQKMRLVKMMADSSPTRIAVKNSANTEKTNLMVSKYISPPTFHATFFFAREALGCLTPASHTLFPSHRKYKVELLPFPFF